jgi:hypothetical protein
MRTRVAEICVSEDQRSTWTQHVDLGPQYLVSKLFPGHNDELQAEVDFQGNAFQLKLASNGNDWLVACLSRNASFCAASQSTRFISSARVRV